MMKIWEAEFDGHWPVGSGAIVIARTKEKAIELVTEMMKVNGLENNVASLKVRDLGTMRKGERVVYFDNGDY